MNDSRIWFVLCGSSLLMWLALSEVSAKEGEESCELCGRLNYEAAKDALSRGVYRRSDDAHGKTPLELIAGLLGSNDFEQQKSVSGMSSISVDSTNDTIVPTRRAKVAKVLIEEASDLIRPGDSKAVAATLTGVSTSPSQTYTVEYVEGYEPPWFITVTNAVSVPPAVCCSPPTVGFIVNVDSNSPSGLYYFAVKYEYRYLGVFIGMDAVLVTIRINSPPTTSSQSVSVDEDGSVGIILVGNDPDGDLIGAVVVQPEHGSISPEFGVVATTTFTYTPASNYHGTDSFGYAVFDEYYVNVDELESECGAQQPDDPRTALRRDDGDPGFWS